MTDRKNTTVIFGPMRLPFLVLTPACVVLGTATAISSGSEFSFSYFLLALIGAVSAHIGVNAINEYDDFKSGLDFTTEPTPFSGGSGTLPKNPEKAHSAFITGLISIVITSLVGLYFLYVRGPLIFPLGIVGLIVVITYTRWLTKNPILCLIAPGLGFGILMVMGTDFILSGSYSLKSFIASLVPFFLVSDLLLLNQFPDVEADGGIGRRHLPIVIGRRSSARIYTLFLAGAYVSIILGYLLGVFPLGGLLALASIFLAVPTVRGVMRYADDILRLIPYMGRNVLINIMTPVLLAIGFFIGC